MSINITHMIEDNVQPHLIKLASMSSSDLFEKIAIHVENPHMFKHFMGSAEEAPVWDFAYAAGLITRAEADLMNVYEGGGRAPWHKEEEISLTVIFDEDVAFSREAYAPHAEYAIQHGILPETPDVLYIQMGEENFILPKCGDNLYGEMDGNNVVFTTYPLYISSNDNYTYMATPNIKTVHIKISIAN